MADALDGQQASLRHALAIAIVRNKRWCVQEAAEWRAKAQKLENDLQDQQAKQAQLQQWVANVLQQQQKESSMPEPLEQTQVGHAQLLPAGIFLPPLSCDSWISDQQQPAVNLHALRKQVALAAAAAGDGYSSVAALMEGKAAALSHILLTNVQMLQQLSAQPSTGSTGGSSGSSAQGHASECVSGIGTFITSTLLQAPKSSLSSAYMKQSATVLAAVLAPPASNAIDPAAAAAGATGCSQHSQHGQLGPDSPEALAVQVVQLMQQLLQLRAAGAANNLDAETGANSSSAAVGAAATVTLQQLSTFPSTALLLCLAAAQHMQQCVQELQEANAVVTRTSPSSFCMCAGAAEQALLVASQAFQAAHELLLDLEGAVLLIPIWGVALASSSWTPRALEDLVVSIIPLYQACADLQTQQPLLSARICSLCANLATALQQLAANGDAPGMRVGLGAELRSVTGGLCVKLRDVLMP